MDKIYIEVYIPGINKSYDIVLSVHLKVKDAAEYIFRTVSEYELLNMDPKNLFLCDRRTKRVHQPDKTLLQCELRDGSRLLLV